METKRTMRLLSLLAALAMIAALATGCGSKNDGGNNGGSDVQGQTAALTEEEYISTVDQIMQDYLSMGQNVVSLVDADDPEGLEELFISSKAHFETFLQITPPEKYASADAKLKTACQAVVDMIDISVVMIYETDPDKTAEYESQMQELGQTFETNFEEGVQMLQNAG